MGWMKVQEGVNRPEPDQLSLRPVSRRCVAVVTTSLLREAVLEIWAMELAAALVLGFGEKGALGGAMPRT